MKTFELNGNTVNAKKIDFNLLADLDDYGVSIEDAGAKPLVFMRAYIAVCLNKNLTETGEEINAHIVGGGDLGNIMDVLDELLEESDFFRALQNVQDEQTEVQETTTASKAKKGK